MRELKKLLSYSALSIIAVLSSQAYAAGYKIEFQSPSILADGGQAAVVEDAGTNWYNAGGITKLPQQFTMSMIDVYAPTTFHGSTFAPNIFGFPNNFTGSGAASSHTNILIPALHYTLPIKNGYAFALSVVPSFGFIEDYGLGSMVRYTLTRIYTKNIDISPSFAVQINDRWSLGAGPDFNYFAVSNRFNVRTEGPAPFGTPGDSISRFTANTWGYGWHAGLLFSPNEATRFGLAYRSKIVLDMSGYSEFNIGIPGANFSTNQFRLNFPLPPVTTFSAYHDINARWAVMGTIAYDQWGVIRAYNAFNIIQPGGALVNQSILQSFNNTFDYSLGAHYKYNDRLLLRGSLKYLPTPTNNRDRDIGFPDGNKFGINIGSRYQMTKKLAVDLIYGHVFTKNVSINSTNPITGATANGHASTTIDLVGGQLVWDI